MSGVFLSQEQVAGLVKLIEQMVVSHARHMSTSHSIAKRICFHRTINAQRDINKLLEIANESEYWDSDGLKARDELIKTLLGGDDVQG